MGYVCLLGPVQLLTLNTTLLIPTQVDVGGILCFLFIIELIGVIFLRESQIL